MSTAPHQTPGAAIAGRRDQGAAVGWIVALTAAAIYLRSGQLFDAGRDDFFYLAEAFLQGRAWLDFAPGPWDVILIDGRSYVPFAPFPAVLLMPVVGVFGASTVDAYSAVVNAAISAAAVGMAWLLVARLGVGRTVDRIWLVALLGFSTSLWWVTTRGGPWHTGQIIATVLTLACLVELSGQRRAWLIGLLAGAAFLTRAPLAFAVPFYMFLLEPNWLERLARPGRPAISMFMRGPLRRWFVLGLATVPSIAFFFWYNAVRFGDPLESGYGLAALPDWLAARREVGLFATAHIGMNVDLMLLKLPAWRPEFPFFRPSGDGMSVLFTSPGLLLAVLAPWRRPQTWWLAGAAIAVLVPTLLYYGGGWLQYGYRYFLDSVPFVFALVALGVAKRGLGLLGKVLILFGVAVGTAGLYWVDKI